MTRQAKRFSRPFSQFLGQPCNLVLVCAWILLWSCLYSCGESPSAQDGLLSEASHDQDATKDGHSPEGGSHEPSGTDSGTEEAISTDEDSTAITEPSHTEITDQDASATVDHETPQSPDINEHESMSSTDMEPLSDNHSLQDASTTQDAARPESSKETVPETPKESLPEPQRCRDQKDCTAPSCQNVGTSCKQSLATCEQGICKALSRTVANAQCASPEGFCRFVQDICAESYEGAQLSSAIYPSESIAALPAKFKQQKTIQGSSRDGTMMFFTSDDPHTVCHAVFKGVSPQSIKDLVAALSSAKSEDCKTATNQNLGKCGSGFYTQYVALRNAGAVSYVRSWVESWNCPGGLRMYGHSMGGSQAALLATELFTTDAKTYNRSLMRLYTYGAPRLYTTTPANQYHSSISAIRWVNDGDAVPTTPPSSLNFRHFGSTYQIERNNGKVTFSKEGQDYSPTPDLFNLDDAHKYGTYTSRLKNCSGL